MCARILFLAASSRSRSIRSRGSAACCDQVETLSHFRSLKGLSLDTGRKYFFQHHYYIEGRRTLFSAYLGRRTLFTAHFGRRTTLLSAYLGRQTLFSSYLGLGTLFSVHWN